MLGNKLVMGGKVFQWLLLTMDPAEQRYQCIAITVLCIEQVQEELLTSIDYCAAVNLIPYC